MSRTAHPERVHVHACGADPSSFTFQNETVGERRRKKNKQTKTPKTRQSQDAALAVKDTTVRRLSYCSDAFGSAVDQTQILNYRRKKKKDR